MHLTFHINKSRPQPKGKITLNFMLRNKYDTLVYIENVSMIVPWKNAPIIHPIDRILQPTSQGLINPRYNYHNLKFNIDIPKNIVGIQHFQLIITYSLSLGNDQWDYSRNWTSTWTFTIIPHHQYTAFVPRSIRPHEGYFPNEITQLLHQWNFKTLTVGIEVQVGNRPIEDVIRETIHRSDIIFAIATKRDQLENGLGWRTLEYLQGELGISFENNKPIVVIVEKWVDLGGLASCFNPIVFDPKDFLYFRQMLNDSLYDLREWLNQIKNKEFWENISKGIFNVGVPLVLSFLGGVAVTKLLSD